MTVTTATSTTPFPLPTPAPGAVRRVASVVRAEALLLRRNPIALVNALVVPAAMVVMVRGATPARDGGSPPLGPTIVTSIVAFSLLLAVYYNLVTALVARREELVLKRLRTGETSDAEILLAVATPAIALAWGQAVIGVVASVVLFGMPAPVNPVLIVVAVAAGTALFVLLATASTAMTRNVEMAQVTTMPVVLVPMLLSGLFLPLGELPEPVRQVADVSPLTAVLHVLRLGLSGETPEGTTVGFLATFAHAAVPLLALAAWTAVAAWATRRWFRWEPRR